MKILILVLDTTQSSYQNFRDAIRNTWLKKFKEANVAVLFYRGNSDKDYISDDGVLNLAVQDDLKNTASKLLRALTYLHSINFDYDLIFRTNLSSYIFVENFMKYLSSNDLKEKYYSGIIGHYSPYHTFFNRFALTNKFYKKIKRQSKILFASGCGFFISHDLVNILIADNLKNLNLIDDVMVGDSMQRHGVELRDSMRMDINGKKIDLYNSDSKTDPLDIFHVRIKSKNRHFDANEFYWLEKYQNAMEYKNNRWNIT